MSVIATALGVPAAQAADHLNLEAGFPGTIEDAYPVKARALEVQGLAHYERVRADGEDSGHDRHEVAARLEYGAAPDFQVSMALPYRTGNAHDTEQGDVQFDGLFNFNTEGVVLPAMSLAAGLEQPYGSRGGGTETHVKGILTKTLDVAVQDYRPRRLHFNVAWFHNWEPTAQERPNRYLVGLAYSQPLNNDTVLVAEVFREAQRQQDKDYNFANLGVRRQLTPLTLVTLGAGAGFGDDAPRWQVMVGFQHTLGTWPLGM